MTQSVDQIQKSSQLPTWWKQAVFYQVYPRSFKNTNGSGVGDINGIIEKLDYLKQLGIDAIWINPHYDSPNTDNGYDIRNYEKIMEEYGTMEDFDRLISEMQKRNMRLMVDVVINHSSDQHEWFVQSRSSKDNPYRDYYFWRDEPNNYPSFFGGSAWTKDDTTGQYYLHYFAKEQPDLNWDNPKVREELYNMLRFWLDKGVSGFRLDTVATFSKISNFPEFTPEQVLNFDEEYTKGPHLHQYIREINEKVFSEYDVVTAGEIFGVPTEESIKFTDHRRKELNMAFTFDLVRLDVDHAEKWRRNDWTLPHFRKIIHDLHQTAGEHGWNAFFLDNHDNPRVVSHFGDDRPEWRVASAKALGTVILTQPATPFIYQGTELGMTNYPFQTIEDFDDIGVTGFWKDLVETGKVPADKFLEASKYTSRDNARTPFQWDDTENAGFTTGTPWLKVNPNYKEINAARQVNDPDSVFSYYKSLIQLRHEIPTLTYGSYHDLDLNHDSVYAYTRIDGDYKYLVVVNFKDSEIDYPLPEDLSIASTVIESSAKNPVQDNATSLQLAPWQSGIYRLN
ncbi:glycoside hydrolase family 13 protein [Acinetobacter nectaris]|uniref:glycoside hydrolase family 13 protein n=1 Tax=Acinetobacter nectaris TaxID=1219382 RepID=UPI001F3071C2|nr:alpha-glucosidase [Acinetobacter nectaris]MCF9046289.1 alpha-glucosidase [Acinetobacter nectaris]